MPEITITLKTIDESSKPVKKVKEEFQSLIPGLEKAGRGIGDFVSKNATLIAGVVATGAALKASYDAFQQYAGQVRDLALVSGTSAEEASRLLQVLDDFQISAEDVTAATRAMTKEGLTPNIETLAKLSDEYLKITDAQKQNEFVIKNLGRAGLQWVNVLEQGSDAINEMSGEVSKSLILTDEQIEKSEKARLAVDSLADAWQGLKVQIGAAIGEQIVELDQHKQAIALLKAKGIAVARGVEGTQAYADAIRELNGEMKAGGPSLEERDEAHIAEANAINNHLIPSLEELEKIEADFQKRRGDLIDLTIDLTDSSRDYAKTQADITQEVADHKAALQELMPWETEKRDEIMAKIDELNGKYSENAAEFEEATNRKLAMMTIEKIAMLDGVAGYSEAEAEKANAVLNTLGIVEDSALRQVIAFDTVSSAIANGTLKAKDLDAALRLMEKGYTIDAIVNMILGQTIGHEQSASPSGPLSGGYATGTGGWLTVPSGYPNDSYPIWLTSGEQFAVVPNGQTAGGGGASSVGGGMDTSQVMALFTPILNQFTQTITSAVRSTVEKTGR